MTDTSNTDRASDYDNDDVTKDRTAAMKSERDIEAKQDDPEAIEEVADEEGVDASDIEVLPGTGGPDDVGDIEVDPAELNLSGDSIPGHPKPGSPEDVS